jgi:hypothetical protein
MNWIAFWITLVGMEYLVFWQAALANGNEMLTVWQMREYRGIMFGLPFLWHGGMWGDVFIISPVVAWIVGEFWTTWSWPSLIVCGLAGFTVSNLMHDLYRLSVWPEAHVEGRELTDVGYVHHGYMSIAFAVLFEYYLKSVTVGGLSTMWLISALLVVHVAVGNHLLLGLAKRLRPERFEWYPGDPLRSWGSLVPVGLTALGTCFGGYLSAWSRFHIVQ